MGDSPLVVRVLAHLQRETAWLEESLRDWNEAGPGLSEDQCGDLLRTQAQRKRELDNLLRVRSGLLHEWRRAEDIGPEDREMVRARAEEAETLKKALQQHYEEGVRWAEREAAGRSESLGALRMGRDLLGRYRPGSSGEAGFLDKKA